VTGYYAARLLKGFVSGRVAGAALVDDAGFGITLREIEESLGSGWNVPRGSGPTVGDLRSAGLKDAHHVIQDAAVRDLAGYDTNAAPGAQLAGPASRRGTPHYAATQIQREAGGGTYAAERRIAYKALRRAGFTANEARATIHRADTYFRSLGVLPETRTRIPGNRRRRG